MSLELCLYLIDVLEKITMFTSIIFVASAALFIGIICFVFFAEDDLSEEGKIELLGLRKKSAIALFFSLSFCTFVPSPKTMYMIAGTNYLKQSDIPQKVRQLLDKKLEELLTIEKE